MTSAPPTGFIPVLHAFDSHERGILLQWATTEFRLSSAVRESLQQKLKLATPVPADAFVAMDYTLDWLFAAIQCLADPSTWTKPDIERPDPKCIKATQEDVDLLIAWEDAEKRHLVLIEAKGFTGWSNKQMQSKADRLKVIFDSAAGADLDLHFVLAGPKHSSGLNISSWPEWMKMDGRFHFMSINDPGARWSIRRDNSTEEWQSWRLRQRTWG